MADDEPSYETHPEDSSHGHKKKKKDKKEKKSKRKHLDVSVEYVQDAPDRTPPVVGYFSSGFEALAADDVGVQMFRHKRKESCVDLVVRPSGTSLEFVGTSYKGEAEAPRICTYALGVLDKESQTLKIVPIVANKVFRLEPYLEEKESTHAEQSEVTEASATGKVDRKMADLTNMFGARKDKVQQRRMQNIYEQINTEAPEIDHIGATQDDGSEAETSTSGISSVGIIPPHDPTADEPERAYPLDQIIPRGERPYLLNILNDLNDKQKYPSFVANRMHQLKSQSDETTREELACILSYITHLISFWDTYRYKPRYDRSSTKTTENRTSFIPQIVFQKLTVLFMSSESKVLSTEKHELLIAYILVLTLFADNFNSEATDIAKDLKMAWPVLKLYYIQLGCKVKGTNVTLPVPLKFPDMKKRKRKQPRQ